MRRHHLVYIVLIVSFGINACVFFSLIWNSQLIDGRKGNDIVSSIIDSHNWETRVISMKDIKSTPFTVHYTSSQYRSHPNTTETSKLAEIRGILVYQNSLQPLYLRNISELYNRIIPNNIFFVWCGKRVFEYQHYLSVHSVWYLLEPDTIEIHYEYPPQEDKYNTWLSTLRTRIPALSLQPLPSYITKGRCNPTFGLELIIDRGGLFINDGVILHSNSTSGLNFLLNAKPQLGFFPDKTIAWVAATRRESVLKQYVDNFIASGCKTNTTFKKMKTAFQNKSVLLYSCASLSLRDLRTIALTFRNTNLSGNDIICLRFKRSPHPLDFSKEENKTNSLMTSLKRLIFRHHDLSPKDSTNEMVEKDLIPAIIHYVWFGSKRLSFSMYLSFLSCVNIIRPTAILIHTDLMLSGPYWDKIQQHPLVHVVFREPPRTIFGHRILYTQHRSDVVRADILEKYGGIYLDWDAFWVKPVDDLLTSRKDVILSRDHIPRLPFPDTINMGVVLARPRSTFIRRWRSSLVNYRSHDFLYNAVELPYKVYENNPETVFLHDRLQAICYFLKCHPALHPDFKHWEKAQPFDWRTGVHALRFTHPDPPAFENEIVLQQSQGMFGDVGRYIWNAGGSSP